MLEVMANPTSPPAYLDPATGETFPLQEPRWRAPVRRAPDGHEPARPRARRIDTKTRSLWRYAAALPVAVRDPISMGEGCTPLVFRRWRGADAALQARMGFATGSFKDRGASVMLSILKQQGVTRSSRTVRATAAPRSLPTPRPAGMKAKILVPAAPSPARSCRSAPMGRRSSRSRGPRGRADEADAAGGLDLLCEPQLASFFLQGTKTLAYELWEDLGFRAPDAVIVPTGAGSNVLGCDIGFAELLAPRRDRRFAALLRGAAGELRAAACELLAGRETARRRPRPTIAEGTAIARPVRAREVLAASGARAARRSRSRGRDRGGVARLGVSASMSSRPRRRRRRL